MNSALVMCYKLDPRGLGRMLITDNMLKRVKSTKSSYMYLVIKSTSSSDHIWQWRRKHIMTGPARPQARDYV